MADYRFVTTWEFSAPIEDVWSEVGDPPNWVNFWPGLEGVTVVEPGDADGRNASYELVFKSFLPYTLSLDARTVAIEPPRHIEMRTTGELEGTAIFDLDHLDGKTISTLVWSTRTTLPWMNAVAPLMRGLFEWNHDVLMRKAGNGLAERIGTSVTHREGSAPSLAAAVAPPALAVGVIALVVRSLIRRASRFP